MTLKSVGETLKNDGSKVMAWLYKKLTKTQIGIASVVLTAIVLVLFLCTQTGRNVISFISLVAFGLGVAYGGYRLFIHTTTRAYGQPKTKKEKTQNYEDELDKEDELIEEDDSTVPEKAGEQITIDSLVNQDNNKNDEIDEDADNM